MLSLEGAESYVDSTVVYGVLAGLLVLVAVVWAWYVHNRLWQTSMLRDGADGFAAARDAGLKLLPVGYGACIRMEGSVAGDPVVLEWRGGLLGTYTLVRVGEKESKRAFIDSGTRLYAALRGDEEE